MQPECDVCGRTYTAQRSTSRFCSSRCRGRHHAAGGGPATSAPGEVSTAITDACRRELVEFGLLNSCQGQLSLVIAGYMDRETTARGLVAQSCELRRQLAEIRNGEALAGLLRPGNAGSNTAADQ